MDDSPLQTLARWEDAGAAWRLVGRADGQAVVALCACTGETVDVLRSRDPALLGYLARRRDSATPPPDAR
ncbi:hypothetical protein [Patulibacter sp. SYSU D01012]|uniref:hypothetical protein n=1 Tax=Patulibacter sp. SYSU D01012 TaxID=2817381 RepID=UPI001B3036C0|nr:hypothetical protein [Patulibacter sp. SYSU D01012]